MLATTAIGALLAATIHPAEATSWSNFTNSSFITLLPGNDSLTFTFDGKAASNIDSMDILFSGGAEHFLVSNTAATGTTVTVTGFAPGQTYSLELIDNHTGQRWSSDPSKDGATVGGVTYTSDRINGDGDSCSHGSSCVQAPHLAFTTSWSNFGLAGPAPGAPGSTYYGWEDLPLAGNVSDASVSGGVVTQIITSGGSGDYNDLVFQVTQSASRNPVPEPASVAVLCTTLLGIGVIQRRRVPAQL